MRKIAVILIVMLAAAVAGPCAAQEPAAEQRQTKQMFGTISQVSFVMGFIVVFSDAGYLTVQVTPETLITQGFDKISFSDIDNGDSVIVRYYTASDGKNIAISIRDSKQD